MNRQGLKRLAALLMALLLLASMAGVAEESIAIESVTENEVAVEAAPEQAPEEGVEELTQSLDELAGLAPSIEVPQDETQAAVEGEPAEEAPVDGEAVQNAVPETLELGVKQTYTLSAKSLAPGKKITYKSSKSKVAKVSSKGVITAVKKGTAVIGCFSGSTLLASCTVTVVNAPKKVSLGMSKLTLGVKEKYQLNPTITSGTRATFTWSSSKKSVATVSKDGVVTGKKAGKATITVKTQNGKKAKVTVTVVKAPGSVALSQYSASMTVGETLTLKASTPKDTGSTFTWTSSNGGVATVNGSGVVTAVGEGVADITVSTFNGRTATCTVTVLGAGPVQNPVTYRALLIGQEYFNWESVLCTRNRGDVGLMSNMLSSVRGLYGGSFDVTARYDRSGAQVLSDIQSAFAGADDNDVSLFFIASHGVSSETGVYAGALAMSPEGNMTLSTLASALAAVPGQVIVVLESCGSGAAVYANGKDGLTSEEAAAQDAAFDAAVVRAFAAADTGVEVTVQPNGITSNGVRSNTGEFRVENKFFVLTASAHLEDSWGTYSYNLFTKWLVEGIGSSGSMPADTNSNRQTTLNELYSYISKVGDNYPLRDDRGVAHYQHVQVYPANSGYVLFVR